MVGPQVFESNVWADRRMDGGSSYTAAAGGKANSAQSFMTLWSKIIKNPDCSTGPLARPFARSLAPLTRLLAPDCLRPLLRSLTCSLAHFAHSLARGTVNDSMAICSVFFSILADSA